MLTAQIKPVLTLLQLFSEGSLFGHSCEWVDILSDGAVSFADLSDGDLMTRYSLVTEGHIAQVGAKCLAIFMTEEEIEAKGVQENFNSLSSLILISGKLREMAIFCSSNSLMQ